MSRAQQNLRDCTTYVAKTKVLISCSYHTAALGFFFAYEKNNIFFMTQLIQYLSNFLPAVVTMVILDLGWAMDPVTTWEVTPAACKADTLIVLVWPAAEIELHIIFLNCFILSKQCRPRSDCFTLFAFNQHFSIIMPFCSNFRLITVILFCFDSCLTSR